jgi:CheY-like chemotaxis protein
MDDGGHIVVEAGERVRRDGVEAVVLRVTDDGEGMDPSTLAQCQKPFFTTKGRSRGTGLGLATVGSILERSGGTLEIASEPGRGTAVTAFFPEAADTGGPDLLPAQASPARVLLVDDDDQVRRFVQGVLSEAGYDVVATSDAESAIDHAEAGGFALLITDVVLPGMSGVDLVRTVRTRRPEVACLLITGFAGDEVIERDLGDTMLVPKPFTPEALLRAAASVLLSGSAPGPH